MAKQAFLLQCNRANEQTLEAFRALLAGTREFGDCMMLYHLTGDQPDQPGHQQGFVFTSDVLQQMNYLPIGFSLVPGNNHFPLLRFYREHKDYEYYWLVEHDVRYGGSWGNFFTAFEGVDADFISSHIQHYHEIPSWGWWPTLANHLTVVPLPARLRSFNPIYRISRRALAVIDGALQRHWTGHHEVLLPTLISMAGLKLLDLGGMGSFSDPNAPNRFYDATAIPKDGSLTTGTMRWRPVIDQIQYQPGKLYHPVK